MDVLPELTYPNHCVVLQTSALYCYDLMGCGTM